MKLVFFCCLSLLSISVFSQSFLDTNWHLPLDTELDIGLIGNSQTIELMYWRKREYNSLLRSYDRSSSSIYLDKDGYYIADITYTEDNISQEYFLLYSKYGFKKLFPFDRTKGLKINNDITSGKRFDLGISNIRASSFYSEKATPETILYWPDNLLKRFMWEKYQTDSLYYNSAELPWVEGVTGDGAGEYLIITTVEDAVGVDILGGFVDFTRRHLFRQNNRPKTIRISSLANDSPFELIVQCDDSVQFTTVLFPKKTNQFKIEILDIYHGSKWHDTCISAIYPLYNDHFIEYIDQELSSLMKLREDIVESWK